MKYNQMRNSSFYNKNNSNNNNSNSRPTGRKAAKLAKSSRASEDKNKQHGRTHKGGFVNE